MLLWLIISKPQIAALKLGEFVGFTQDATQRCITNDKFIRAFIEYAGIYQYSDEELALYKQAILKLPKEGPANTLKIKLPPINK